MDMCLLPVPDCWESHCDPSISSLGDFGPVCLRGSLEPWAAVSLYSRGAFESWCFVALVELQRPRIRSFEKTQPQDLKRLRARVQLSSFLISGGHSHISFRLRPSMCTACHSAPMIPKLIECPSFPCLILRPQALASTPISKPMYPQLLS